MLAACPVLALYGQNAATLTIDRIYPALTVFVVVTFVVWLVIARACRDIHRAGAATSVCVMTGFLAWPILETAIEFAVPIRGALPTFIAITCVVIAVIAASAAWYMYVQTRVGRVLIGVALILVLILAIGTAPAFGRRAAIAIALYTVTSGVIAGSLLFFRGDQFRLTSSANVFGGALLILYAGYALLQDRAQAMLPQWPPSILGSDPLFEYSKTRSELPDVYVFALDGYPREDVLAEAFQFDNTPFLDDLTEQGFVIAQGAHSADTEPVQALAACFNFAPVDDWLPESLSENARAHYIQRALDQGQLLPALRKQGYELTGFDSGIEALRPSQQFDEIIRPMTPLREFERILFDRTIAARAFQFYFYVRYRNPVYWQFEPTRRYVNFVFDQMPLIAEQDSEKPRFVFAYMPVPEPPFLFRNDGERAYPYAIGPLDTARLFFDPQLHRHAFLDQLGHLNHRLSKTVRDIQVNAKGPSVIMLVSLRGAALRGAVEGPPPRAQVFAAARGVDTASTDKDDVLLVEWFGATIRSAIMSQANSRP